MNDETMANRFARICLFARNFLKHPGSVGGPLPSSKFVVDQVVSRLDCEKARLIVEYGPGVGTITAALLDRMQQDAHLVAFEINRDFCEYLRGTINDPRFHLLQASATEVDSALAEMELPPADYIISGIPFKTLPHSVRGLIVRKTYSVLKPTGQFLVYQVSSAVLPYLEQVFPRVHCGFEPFNVTPIRLFYCVR